MSMSTGVTALDHSVQEINVWLKAIDEQLALENRHQAYSALRAVLHALRDRLPPEVVVKLGAQLPIMVRGIYYEGWRLAATPTKERHIEEFAAHVAKELPPQFPLTALGAARGVYAVLWEKLDPGEFEKLMAHLPAALRNLQG
ncbi:uncharacterized protein (DUF2267 family) [Bradyrhizobium sp. R2.2-H]|jgi:uncharacterized protein (DUF2267 family)|uniref:DUF2267 domain-containing protein n=1 Tax=unclassified Bradyrhizobium TaxID=2631580 RepID=UPI0010E7D503|nr:MULTISPECIES: DUF2267 domain-containing protein [unclassified Bradyrhizobium]TCU76478.1 uncharacterized protein (DUF2267 family) [Bradyrhizobium sp. Y-H1]TCU79551.1 uncharacterized protein (DUF2267 family) [Bradyrhizobium sp. R2.2-H]